MHQSNNKLHSQIIACTPIKKSTSNKEGESALETVLTKTKVTQRKLGKEK